MLQTVVMATNDLKEYHFLAIFHLFASFSGVSLGQEGGGVSRVNIGRLITTSVTSRHTSMFFKMAGNFLVRYSCKR